MLQIMKKSVMPLMTAGMLALGVSACQNQNSQNQKLEEAREAIEFTKTYGADGAEFLAMHNAYNIGALDAVQEEKDNETAKAFNEFEINGENNTRWDSIYISALIADRNETKEAVRLLKNKAALEKYGDPEELLSNLKEKPEPSLTVREQDSIAKTNISNYKQECAIKDLLRILYMLNYINNNIAVERQTLNNLSPALEKLGDTANIASDSAYLEYFNKEMQEDDKAIEKAE